MVAALDYFRQKLDFGQVGESKIAIWIRATKEASVLPTYEIEIDNGKGPRLFCPEGNLVVPDMLIINGKKVTWVEAKRKTIFTWHRLTGRWTTGINLRHYLDYLKVANRTPFPVWLLFLQEKSNGPNMGGNSNCHTGLYGGELIYLSRNENHRWLKGDMVYWAEETLTKLATIEEVNRIYQKWSHQ